MSSSIVIINSRLNDANCDAEESERDLSTPGLTDQPRCDTDYKNELYLSGVLEEGRASPGRGSLATHDNSVYSASGALVTSAPRLDSAQLAAFDAPTSRQVLADKENAIASDYRCVGLANVYRRFCWVHTAILLGPG